MGKKQETQKSTKENYSVANQYIKKHADKTWWNLQVGKPKQQPLIRKRK